MAQPQIVGAIVAIVGLVLAVVFGRSVAAGNFKIIYAVFVFTIGAALILALGKRYWLLAPIGFALHLPLLPMGFRSFELPEIAAAGVFGIFIMMLALHRNYLHLFKIENTGVFLFFGLVALVYALNPVGLLVGGSSVVGGRFYLKILLSFLIYIALTNQTVDEVDAKWIIRFFLIGSIVTMCWGLVDYFILGNTDTIGDDEFYSWHQILAGPPFIFSVWMFSRYRPSQVFSMRHLLLPVLYVAGLFMAFASGKRAMVASIFFVPLLASMLHRQWRYAVFAGILVFAFFSVVIMGQGNLFQMPRSAQRALMYLPAGWDPEINALKAGGTMDEFRKQMREKAWDKAVEKPWLGEGLKIDLADTVGMGSNILQQDAVGFLALGRSWHSFWLGLAADFGFIAWLFYALIYITAFHTAASILRMCPVGSQRRTLTQMFLIFIILSLSKSYTSGHSAETPFGEWWSFAVLVAMKYTLTEERKSTARSEEKRMQEEYKALPVGA